MKKMQNYIIDRVLEIPEIGCTLTELTHEPTGAQVMHLGNEDPENVFSILFKTPPPSSNGVAHIVEHTVLCGSKKFPTKDPFFLMTRRSLNTFMNAMTGPDYTCYPAASQVPKDFYNLLTVYLDAVFHPLMKKNSFLQEGWRYELVKDRLQYKGIVYNEMKGVLASPMNRLFMQLNAALYPDTPYGFEYGGDPKSIPTLSYEEFLAFYKEAYHPSRALFYFYGNIPLEKHLQFLEKELLEGVEGRKKAADSPRQKRFSAPKEIVSEYPTEEDDKAIISLGYLTCDILEQKEQLALQLIISILMDTDASLLKKTLLKSGLCKQASAFSEEENADAAFGLIFQGAENGAAKPLEKLVLTTLQTIVQDGIDPELIESAIHQQEIARSEITGNGTPYGLSLFFRAALLKQQGGSPEYGLMIHTLFKEIRDELKKDSKYLEGLIQRYLIDNPHRVLLTLKPSKTLSETEEKKQENELSTKQKELSPKEIEEIKRQTKELQTFQDAEDEANIDLLPNIGLKDVPKEAKNFPLLQKESISFHDSFTNGLTYVELTHTLPAFPVEELHAVRLFSILLTQLGFGGRSYEESLQLLQATTGGVWATLNFNTQANDVNQFRPTIHLRGKSLDAKGGKLLHILKEMVAGVYLTDRERVKEIIRKYATTQKSQFVSQSMRYAIQLATSGLNLPSQLSEIWFGLEHYQYIQELNAKLDTLLDPLIAQLQNVQRKLFSDPHPAILITANEKTFKALQKENFFGLVDKKRDPFTPWHYSAPLAAVKSQAFTIASPVAFSAMAMPTVNYTDKDTAALHLTSQILENVFLHPAIREQGGAYGTGASNNPMDGSFYLYAFRDPHIAATLETFQTALQAVAKGDFEPRHLEEAKLEVIQSLDSPIAPGSRGEVAAHWLRQGRDIAVRQQFRDRLLATTANDLQRAVEKHLLPSFENHVAIVFGGKELLAKENPQLKTPLVLTSLTL